MPGSRQLFYILPRAIPAAVRRASGRHFTTIKSGRQQSQSGNWVALITTVAACGYTYHHVVSRPLIQEVHAEEPPPKPVAPEFEKKRRKARSVEENRDIVSSQHLQVKRSWENPGVYAWGSNSGRVAAPDSDEAFIKMPRRISFFDGMILRDIQLDRNFGAAIDERGDLLQWGASFDKDETTPTFTLRGKDLKSLVLSKDRILGLGKDGVVYSVPASRKEQEEGPKLAESSWIPFLGSTAQVSYRKILPKNLSIGEWVTNIAGGLAHVLILTNKGRVFSAASGSEDFPQHGQLGVPGLTWTTRPEGPYDQCHELTTLKGFNIDKIAAGDFHSLVADKEGRMFAFGDNSVGQLGFEYNSEAPVIDNPSLLPTQALYSGSAQVPKVTSIAAGGNNTYFTVDATQVASQKGDNSARERALLGRITADTWACGQGIWGNLANGRWTHVQDRPSKIPSLSGLFEYDELKSRVIPIRLSYLSVGATHAVAVMDNITSTAAQARRATDYDTNWGADLVFWGNNEFFQLGTGKRNNINEPIYIQPLDRTAEKELRGREEHRFQISPRHRVKVNGRSVNLEQRIVCGRSVTAVYSAC